MIVSAIVGVEGGDSGSDEVRNERRAELAPGKSEQLSVEKRAILKEQSSRSTGIMYTLQDVA